MKSLPIIILFALVVGCSEPEREEDIKSRTKNNSSAAVTHGVTLDFDTTVVDNTTELDVY